MEPKNYSTIRSILKKEQGEKIAPYIFKINDTQTLCNGLFSFDDFSFVYETWRGSTNYFTKLKCHVKLIFIRNILLVSYLDV